MDIKITEKVAKHSVLRTMACTLEEYDYNKLRKLYEAYNLQLTPIEKNARIWHEEKAVKGDQPRRYSYNKIIINPERWAGANS